MSYDQNIHKWSSSVPANKNYIYNLYQGESFKDNALKEPFYYLSLSCIRIKVKMMNPNVWALYTLAASTALSHIHSLS